MATGYWRGADNATWNTTTNWWTTIGGTTTVATVPGAGETAFFNANGTTTARNVYLNGSRSVGGITLNSNNGGTSIYGGTSGAPTTQSLTIGTGGITLDVNGLAFQSTANIVLGANQTWSNNSNLTVLSQVSGTGSLIKTGSGVLFLTNATGNSYSGGTTLSQSMIQVGSNTALGTGSVTINAGILCSDGTTARSFTNVLSLNGTMTLGNATNTGALTFSGTTTIAGTTALTTASTVTLSGQLTGSGTLTKSGSGDLFLTSGSQGQNTGTFTHSAGTLYIGASASGYPNQIEGPANQNPAVVFNATAYIRGSLTYNWYNVTSGSGDVNIRNNSANGVVLVNSWSGYTGSLRLYADSAEGTTVTQRVAITNGTNWTNNNVFFYLSGSGLTSLTQTLAWTGSGNLTSGNLLAIQPGSGTVTAVLANESSNAGTLTVTSEIQHTSTTNATFQIAATNGPIVLNNVIRHNSSGGVLSLTKTGTNAATLSGANTFTGSVSVSAGTLNANSATALGAANSTASISVTSGATLSLGGASNITYTAPRTLTLAGSGVGGTAGALVVNNTVTNTFSGIALTAGTVIRGSESGTLTAPVTTNNHNLTLTVANTKTLTLSSTSVISASTSTVSYNTVSGDTGTAVVSAQNLYTNPTVISQGTVRVGASYVGSPGSVTSGPLGRGQLTWNGGALDASTTATLGNNVVLGGDVSFGGTAALTLAGTVSLGASRTITTNGSGGVLTLSGVVSGTGFSLTKAGANTLVLSGANTYSGGTTISGGTLSINADNNLGTAAGSIFIINQAATFKVTSTFTLDPNRAIRLGLTSGSSTGIIEVDSGQTLTISGFIDDNGAGTGILGKTGAGTLFLLANNAYAGGTNIVAGTVRTVAASSLGTGNVSLTSGSSLWVSRDSFFNITRLTVASLDNGQGCTIKIS